ncbi:MAG: flagellar hook protein FlgE [Firmicutes bacterium]|nr:flagellar hook protein FlgE [Bacillota bacterium]
MLRSLSTAVSGLRNHQTKLDAIGNNIANVNTVGYKSSQVRFQDLFSQTLRGATAPQQSHGGVNPMQVGLGMEVASINTLHTPGAITGTGRETDLAIEGHGYFVVTDGYQQYYTRDGTFTRDSSGILVNANGMQLLGWLVEDEVEEVENGEENGGVKFAGELSKIHIPLGEEMIARATTEMSFSGNLDAAAKKAEGDDEGDKCSYETHVYDSLGNSHNLTFIFEKTGVAGEDENGDLNIWECTVMYGEEYIVGGNGEDSNGIDPLTLFFTPEGRFVPDSSDEANGDYTFTIDDLETGAKPLTITLDFSALSQLSYPSNVSLQAQDGFPPGDLSTFNIEATGMITGTYSNGMVRELGQLALASFANPEGLLKKGGNLYELSSNSGQPRLGTPGTEGRGLIRSRALEMSNVDLSDEFTEMITTSRAFQANTRVITTSDEVLLELINIKR